MDKFRSSSINNSRATHNAFINPTNYIVPFSESSLPLEETQSASVTPSGYLWQQKLALITNENSSTFHQTTSNKEENRKNVEQDQKKIALLQLLRSWREGDEEEQRDTWQYLKRALDEDRFSERKLFP